MRGKSLELEAWGNNNKKEGESWKREGITAGRTTNNQIKRNDMGKREDMEEGA